MKRIVLIPEVGRLPLHAATKIATVTAVASFLLLPPFSSLYGEEGVFIDGIFNGELTFNSPSLNLGQLSLEGGHVAWAKGVRGAMINPAALSEIKKGEVATAYVQQKSWKNFQKFSFNGGSEIGTVNLPVSMEVHQTGGFGYLLAGIRPSKPGRIVLGGGDLGKDLFDLNLLGLGNADMEFSYLVPYTLTSNDFSDLPAGVEIPVEFQVEGKATASLNGEMHAKLVTDPAFFALALDGGRLGFGLGVKRSHIEGELSANFTLRGNGSLQASTSTTTGGWTADLTGRAIFNEQDLSRVVGSIGIQGEAISVILGTLLKAESFRMGLTIEGTPSIPLRSDYNLSILKPFDPPTINGIQNNGVVVDTVAQTIQGDVILDLSPLPLSSAGDGGAEAFYTLPKEINIRFGMAMNLSPVLLLVVDVGRSYTAANSIIPVTSFSMGIQLVPEAPISFHTGFNFSIRSYQLADKTWYVPRGAATVGSTIRVTSNFEANLSASTNTLTFAGSSFEEISRQITPRQLINSSVVGFGVKVGF